VARRFVPDPKLPDPKLPDPKLPDPKLPDPKLPDPNVSVRFAAITFRPTINAMPSTIRTTIPAMLEPLSLDDGELYDGYEYGGLV
jgi:hypothetical protein